MIELQAAPGCDKGWFYEIRHDLIGGRLDIYDATWVHLNDQGVVDYRNDDLVGTSTDREGAIAILKALAPPSALPRFG